MYSMPHRGLFGRGFHRVGEAMEYGIRLIYWGSPLPQTPVTDGILSKAERNNQLQTKYHNGVSVSVLAEQFDISPQHAYQILRDN
jgi:hypothetical protein